MEDSSGLTSAAARNILMEYASLQARLRIMTWHHDEQGKKTWTLVTIGHSRKGALQGILIMYKAW